MRLLLLVFLVACHRPGAEPVAGTPPETPAPAPAPAAAPPPAPVCPPAPPAPAPSPAAPSKAGVSIEALLQGLPGIQSARSSPGGDWYSDSIRYALLEPNPDNLGQIAPAVHAVAAKPADPKARFFLACTLAQHGQHEHANAELRALAGTERCPACADALANVADPLCGFDDKAREIVAAIKPSPVYAAAVEILASINSGDTSKIGRYLEGTSAIVNHCGVCDEDISTRKQMTRAQFLTFVRGAEERYGAGPYIYNRPILLLCDGGCCSGPPTRASHTQITVLSICFRGPADAPKLDVIETVSG